MRGKGVWLFRPALALKEGYCELVTPSNSSLKNLCYGRLWLKPGCSYSSSTDEYEVALICLKGRAFVKAGLNSWEVLSHDVVYLPKGFRYEVYGLGEGLLDLAVAKAPSTIDSEPVLIPFEEVGRDLKRRRSVGFETCLREVFLCLGPEVKACRLMAGFTFLKGGNWSSWPPHEHGARQEEIYVFYNIPKPGFAIQLVYTSLEEPEFVGVVREDDAVVIPEGYHPNVAPPGFEVKYLWILCGLRPMVDRDYGAWTYQPGFT